MTSRARASVTMRRIHPGTTLFEGATVLPAIKAIGCKYQRAPKGPGYLVPARRAEDIAALLQHRWNVDVVAVAR